MSGFDLKMPKLNEPNPFFGTALRLDGMLSFMEPSVRQSIIEQLKEAEIELNIQQAVSSQLEAELQADLYRDHISGTADSLLYQKLPPELRSLIFSYVVAADKSVHVFPPKGNEAHGWRLSLCDESNYDFELGECRCGDSRGARNLVQGDFFHNAIFLVSQSVRREALDAFFITNKFTFTALYELVRFTSMFKQSSSKIQRLRLFERVDDYAPNEFRIKGVQKARQRLKSLKHLELHMFISSWSAYETLYEDGLVAQLLHFALGPPVLAEANEQERMQRKCSDLYWGFSKAKSGNNDGDESVPRAMRTKFSALAPAQIQRSDSTQALALTTTSSAHQRTSNLATIASTPIQPSIQTQQRPSLVPRTSPPFTPPASFSTSKSPPTTTTTPFSTSRPLSLVPPLHTFTPTVRMRTLSYSRFNTCTTIPPDPQQAYRKSLYARLSAHLTDVFMDNGRRYRRVEDVPSLGEKPKVKVSEAERELVREERRGILYLRD